MISELLQHPAMQAGVAPLAVALIVAASLVKTRFAWLAILAGYACMIALTTGFAFSPLTASRKILLLGLVAPFIGLFADLFPRRAGIVGILLASAAGVASLWVFASVLAQRDAPFVYGLGAGIALFIGVLVALMLRLREDGVRAAAATVGLGLATGLGALLSASTGYFFGGIAIAASAGALLLIQMVSGRRIAAGFLGTLSAGWLAALFAAGTLLLAELPWYVLPLLALVPAATLLPVPERSPALARAFLLGGYAVFAAALPVLAAWFAAAVH